MRKLDIYLLHSIFERLPDKWPIDGIVNMHYSPTMHELYMNDFPNAWSNSDSRKSIATIGANDYFYKWKGIEFLSLKNTPLSNHFKQVKKELLDGAQVNGVVTAIPLAGGNHQILFYNKNYVDSAPKTFDDLIIEAQKLKNFYNFEYPLMMPTNACYFILPILYGYYADLWTTKNDFPLSVDALYKTICLLSDLIYTKKMLPVKWEQEDSMNYFMNGKSAFCIGGDWNIREFSSALNGNIGVSPLPMLERDCRSTSNASYLFLSSELDHHLFDNAYKFCSTILTPNIQNEIIQELSRMPVLDNFIMDPAIFNDKIISSYNIYKKSFMLPPTLEVSHMYHVLAKWLDPNVLINDSPMELAKATFAKLNCVEDYLK